MKANQARFAVVAMCRLLGVSTSGYYARLQRPPSRRARADTKLTARIRAIHAESDGTYGAPRVHAELTLGDRERVGHNRVARLMRAAGLQGVSRRRRVRTTTRDSRRRPAPDLVERNFAAIEANRLWVVDITYIPTCASC